MRRCWIALPIALLSCGSFPAAWGSEGEAPEVYVAKAQSLGLAAHSPWLRLGHYQPTPGGGWCSQVDGAAFFLSDEGKRDPGAELEATLRGLFRPPGDTNADDHPLCTFPARAAWLSEQLDIPAGELPSVTCAGFSDFFGRLDPVSVTFVFSSYYLNNPVSAFGHTFLRVNSAASSQTPARRELLDYGIDYAAVTGEENAVWYAFKGLFGMFPGKFSAMPYYYKVRKYNDMESRDIWEYDLSLTQDEARFLVRHLWELGRTYMDYWYLTENCSYHILGLLEAARPELDLTSPLAKPVLPANTVKAVVSAPSLVTRQRYRPSIRAQFRERIRDLSSTQRDFVEQLAGNASSPLPPPLSSAQAAAAFDAALDLLERRSFREFLADPGGSAARDKQRLLERRAALGVVSPELVLAPRSQDLPHAGHGSRRAGVGGGAATGDGGFAEATFRIALHDLLDPAPGYPESAQIEFLPMQLRYFFEKERLRLEEGYFVRVLSLSPRDRFEKDLSWKVAAGATTIWGGGCDDGCTAAHLGAGAGLAWGLQDDAALFWTTFDADLYGSPQLDGGIAGGPVRAGAGPAAGLRVRPHPSLVGLATGKWTFLPGQDPRGVWQAESRVRWGWSPSLAASLDLTVRPSDRTVSLGMSVYF
ncbi:MAG: DUF4105 domain-containing protein [Thermodesulfobacteriota bacterium]